MTHGYSDTPIKNLNFHIFQGFKSNLLVSLIETRHNESNRMSKLLLNLEKMVPDFSDFKGHLLMNIS